MGSNRGELELRPSRAIEEGVRLVVATEALALRIPLESPAELARDVRKPAHRVGTVACSDRRVRCSTRLDALEPVLDVWSRDVSRPHPDDVDTDPLVRAGTGSDADNACRGERRGRARERGRGSRHHGGAPQPLSACGACWWKGHSLFNLVELWSGESYLRLPEETIDFSIGPVPDPVPAPALAGSERLLSRRTTSDRKSS